MTQLVVQKVVEIAQSQVEPDAKLTCEQSLQGLGIARH
jgi:hypothetical protein